VLLAVGEALTAPFPRPAISARGRGRPSMGRIAEQVEVCSDGRGTSVLLRFGRLAATTTEDGGPS
jgi:hypothetical protein